MSRYTVRRLAGYLLLHSQARQAMLNGNRESILRQFDLTSEERQVLSRMSADSAASLLAAIESLSGSNAADDETHSGLEDRLGVRTQQLIFR